MEESYKLDERANSDLAAVSRRASPNVISLKRNDPTSIQASDSEYEELPFPSMEGAGSRVVDMNHQQSSDTTLGENLVNAPREQKPFSSVVYPREHVPFKSHHRRGFIPGVPILLSITKVERSSTHRFNPYLYTVELQHGPFQWVVRRRYQHFRRVHTSLFVFRAGLKLRREVDKNSNTGNELSESRKEPMEKTPHKIHPLQEKDHQSEDLKKDGQIGEQDTWKSSKLETDTTSKKYQEDTKADSFGEETHNDENETDEQNSNRHLPRFPKRPDSLLNHDEIEQRRRHLQKYLKAVLACALYRNHPETLSFFEVSEYSFTEGLSKLKEGFVKKRNGDDGPHTWLNRSVLNQVKNCMSCYGTKWNKLWLILQDTFLLGIKPKTGEIRVVLLFDKGQYFVQPNRYTSFAPVRSDQRTRWFVDGQSFMSSVCDVILGAKEEIFITDWWLSPEIYLKRGLHFAPSLRLDNLLARKAEEGVKIFVLLYKEFEFALGLNSLYSKRCLLKKGGRNIKVLRHPDHGAKAEMTDYLWAHHEKLVVVDQLYAFIGGIDLCYGRWDTNNHPLTDLDSIPRSNSEKEGNKFHEHQHINVLGNLPTTSSRSDKRDQSNATLAHVLKSVHQVSVAPIRALSNEDLSDEDHNKGKARTDKSADPYHHDLEGSKLKRLKSAMVQARKKIRRKRGASERRSSSSSDGVSSSDDDETRPETGIENVVSLSDEDFSQYPLIEDVADTDSKEYPPMTLWRGKDYVNFIVKDIAKPEEPEGDNVDRRTTPRMPWHDVSLIVEGTAARDAARHFIQRWNSCKQEKGKFNSNYPYLVPRTYKDVYDVPDLLGKGVPCSTVNCQVVRSVSNWSAGVDELECSIYESMVEAIRGARFYIYIENQFFISSVGDGSDVKNKIGFEIVQRIIRAHRNHEVFRVFLLLPLLPAFEGKIGSATGHALRAILHYEYASLNRGDYSICRELEKRGIDHSQYISFSSLRTHGELLGTPCTELIYIHSKLMIVDDRLVICGSANINDRSLLGNRDSEVALVVEDSEFQDGVFNGRSEPSGKFAGSLRKFLFREHLGLLGLSTDEGNQRVLDPISDAFFHGLWNKTAETNTQIFDDVFLVVPTNACTTLKQTNEYEQRSPLAEFDKIAATRLLRNVKGNLVQIPMKFLEKENLFPPLFAKEGIVPTVMWT
ncbi:phospholipase D2-like isoform X2 [Tigriopus californicus]|uniref:phospholipase D2-like isoform X2 n=1 Tax=Tigriopus californicus TaxID=6832 RepID=UPI0027DA8FD7|nr:phospholipase D2-like isoform X2 [Tigriopus californicus]